MLVQILQYNVWKSYKIMTLLLTDSEITNINIIIMQKLYQQKSMYIIYCFRSCNFWLTYSENEHVRMCFLINKWIFSHCWNMNFIMKNLAILTLKHERERLNIINIYSSSLESYNHVSDSFSIYWLHVREWADFMKATKKKK